MPKRSAKSTVKQRPAAAKVAKRKNVPSGREAKIPVRKHLEAMNEAALVELVLQLAKKHANVQNDLEDRFSTTNQKFVKLETAISRFRPSPSHYDDYDSGMEDQVRQLIADVRKTVDDPLVAMDLLVRIFEKDTEVMESASEYEDSISDVFMDDATGLFGELAQKIDDKKHIEDVLFRLVTPFDDYGTRDDLITNIRNYLPVSNIRNIASRLIDLPRQKAETYGYAGSRALIRRILETIGDPVFFEETLLAFEGNETPEMCVDAARAWFNAKNYIKARQWIEKIPDGSNSGKTECLEMLKVIQAKRKDKSGLAETARELLKTRRTRENFETLIKAVGEKQRTAELAGQIADIGKNKTVSYRDVEFLTEVGATDAAEEYLWHRLPGLSMWGREPVMLAKLMESKKCPLIATVIYRKLIENTLDAGRSKDYPAAISHMNTITKLAPTIKNWKSIDPHTTFVEKLRAKFPNRPSFWPNVKYTGAG